MAALAHTACGRERWSAGTRIARHCHAQAYAAIVLAGGYEECGSGGRAVVGPGDVLFHGPFDAHLDRFGPKGAQILNIALGGAPPSAAGRVADPDSIARLAETNPHDAACDLLEQFEQTAPASRDWPDLLAAELGADPGLRLDAWAATHGLAAETLSRAFGKLFDQTPAAFRAEARARRAFRAIVESDAPLIDIAAASGFADQAHMTRAVRALTGAPPRHWRTASNPFKTAVGAPG